MSNILLSCEVLNKLTFQRVFNRKINCDFQLALLSIFLSVYKHTKLELIKQEFWAPFHRTLLTSRKAGKRTFMSKFAYYQLIYFNFFRKTTFFINH